MTKLWTTIFCAICALLTAIALSVLAQETVVVQMQKPWLYQVATVSDNRWTDTNVYVYIFDLGTNTTQITNDASGYYTGSHDPNASNMPSVATGPTRYTSTNQDGKINDYWLLDGSDDFFYAGTNSTISYGYGGTVGLWVYMLESTRGDLFSAWQTAANEKYDLLWGVTAGKFSFYYTLLGGGFGNVTANSTTSTGEWIFVVGTYSNALFSIYTNGLLSRTDTNVTYITTNSNNRPFRIGREGGGNNAYAWIDLPFAANYPFASNDIYTMWQKTHPTNNLRYTPGRYP